MSDILSIFQLHFTEFNSRLQDVLLYCFLFLFLHNFIIIGALGFHLMFLPGGNWFSQAGKIV